MPQQYFYPEHKIKNNEKASILVTCLWVIMVLSILGMGLAGLVLQEVKFAKTYQRLKFSLPIARAAIKTVFYLRQNDLTPAYDTFSELAKENSFTLCADNSYKYYFVDKKSSADSFEVIDEGALINLNTVSTDVLKRLPGMDEDLVDKLMNSGLRPFSAINEVLLVKEVSRDKFQLFRDLVTVYGSGKVNINTASEAVLLALGLDEELVEIIMRFRKEHKIEEDNNHDIEKNDSKKVVKEPDYGFSSVARIVEDLKSFDNLSLKQEQDLLALLSVLEVKSEYLRFNVIPVSGNKEGLHYSIVIHPATKKILSWSEY